MHNINLSRVDLNLFVIFDVIYREGSLTRASQLLHLSQPAVSHALARMREQFNDPLFERRGKGMVPTPLAKAMINRVRQALQELEITLSEGMAFDPLQAQRVFTLATRDVTEFIALPTLMQQVQQQAPLVQLRSVRAPRRELESMLTSGSLDFALDVLLPVSEDIEHQLIGEEQLMVVMRSGHPLVHEPWTMDAYGQAQHVQVSSRPEGLGVEDVALARLGHGRHVALRCQNYYAAMQVMNQTDLLLTVPNSFKDSLAMLAPGHVIRPFPAERLPLELHLYWQRKANRDPAVMWLKEILVKSLTLAIRC